MTATDGPEVIQGRLGWESGDISEADPSNLKPHPKNAEIYGDTEAADDLDESFKQSVAEKGILEPMVITQGKKIVSGHRRWLAAKAAGLDSVPVRYTEFDSELDEREALIEFNRQREKTPGQIVNEAEELLAVQRELGKEKMSKGGSGNHEGSQKSENHDSWENVAETIGVSRDTLSKGKKVKDKAESEDESNAVREAAQEAWNKLEAGEESFNGAYQEVKKAENKHEKEQDRKQKRQEFQDAIASSDAVKVLSGDFTDRLTDDYTEAFDHVITDPPYDEDAVDEWQKLAQTAERVLKPGGLLAAYSGKYHLPSVYEALATELDYYWQFIVQHSGPGSRVWPVNVRTNYKPVLVFAKPPVEKLDGLAHDVIEGPGAEKDSHEWQQAEAEATALIEQLTEPNDHILDPMCGSGTTGVAALESDRRVTLIDREKDAVESTKERVYDVI